VFLVTSNFDVIKAYNDSTAYALSVALLGDAVKGGRPLQAQWPTLDPQLSEAQVRRLQAKLKTLGYDAGEIDGKIGDQIRAAVRAFQERNGLAPDGYPDLALFKQVSASRCPVALAGSKAPAKERPCGVSAPLPPPRPGSARHL
jgi:peptidoglycan hydrolase-like protein with peptidoglycan-binding domain